MGVDRDHHLLMHGPDIGIRHATIREFGRPCPFCIGGREENVLASMSDGYAWHQQEYCI